MNANFNSPGVHIFPAMKTGNLEVRTDAMVREVLVGPDGLARGVSYVDKKPRGKKSRSTRKIVVLAASCCETARIMLNSKSSQFPNGIANSTGLVGRYIMDTVGSRGQRLFADYAGPAASKMKTASAACTCTCPGGCTKNRKPIRCRLRAAITSNSAAAAAMPGAGTLSGSEHLLGGGYGVELKRNLRKIYGAHVGFSGRGEMIPNDNSYCEIDPNTVDQWGIPVLRFHFKWSDDELLQAKHMQETFKEIIETAGGIVTNSRGRRKDGAFRTAVKSFMKSVRRRWATDPKTSVLNQYCQAWDCKNLFITDAAPFVSNADKNPTLTISALGWRTSEYIADQVKKLNVKV